jgi:hypothetical protein
VAALKFRLGGKPPERRCWALEINGLMSRIAMPLPKVNERGCKIVEVRPIS